MSDLDEDDLAALATLALALQDAREDHCCPIGPERVAFARELLAACDAVQLDRAVEGLHLDARGNADREAALKVLRDACPQCATMRPRQRPAKHR